MRFAFLVLLAGLAAAPAARAFDLPLRAQQALDRGRTYVDVRADPDGESGLIRAAGPDFGSLPHLAIAGKTSPAWMGA